MSIGSNKFPDGERYDAINKNSLERSGAVLLDIYKRGWLSHDRRCITFVCLQVVGAAGAVVYWWIPADRHVAGM